MGRRLRLQDMRPPAAVNAPSHIRAERNNSPGGTASDEPVPHSPLVLTQKHGSELGESVGAVLERPEDRLPLGNRQGENLRLAVVALLELLGGLVEAGIPQQARQLEHVLIAHGDTGERHQAIICSAAGGAAQRMEKDTSAGPVCGVPSFFPSGDAIGLPARPYTQRVAAFPVALIGAHL